MEGQGPGSYQPQKCLDKVDNLLPGDEATTGSGVLLAVLEQGTCDILNTVLRDHKFRGTPSLPAKGWTLSPSHLTAPPSPPPDLQSLG